MTKSKVPDYRLHKATGLAVVTLNGKDCYLGKHGTPESRAEYDAKIAEWLACGRQIEAMSVTLKGLAGRFLKRAASHYREDGAATSTVAICKIVCRDLISGREREAAAC